MLANHLPATIVWQRISDSWEQYLFPVSPIWRAESFRQTEGQPMTLRRAAALNTVLAQCTLPLIPGELLVGSGVGKYSPASDKDELQCAQEYLATIGGRYFTTNFDHAAPDYPLLLQIGIGGLIEKTKASLATQTDPTKLTFLSSVMLALDGASRHLLRWAEMIEGRVGEHPEFAELLTAQATMLSRLAIEPPQTLWEALQLVYLFHTMYQLDDRWAMALGRLDQYTYPFYLADLEAGRITPDDAQTLFDHLFAKLTQWGDIQNICIGGVGREGRDAANPVSYMILEAAKRIGKPGGNITARINAGTPLSFLRKCAEVIRTGIGYPAVFNDEVEIPALVDLGYPIEDARDYCFVGCIEVFIPGRHAPWADSRYNLLRCVNLVLWDGMDNVTGQQLGPRTGEPQSWEEFYAAYLAQMQAGLQALINELNAIKQAAEDHADELTSPLMSALVGHCIERGLDMCAGGAQYPANHGVGAMGIGSVADTLMAIKHFVYDEPRFTLDDMRRMLAANFTDYEAERHLLMRGAPKYGNDDPDVDAIAVAVARECGLECLRHHTPRGGQYWALMAANVQNVSAGLEVGATPDGRLAFEPLSDAASPTFGRDLQGPTAVIRSISKLDYKLCPGGNVINIKFHPTALQGEEGLIALAALIRTCFNMGGIELQFNTTDREMLHKAMESPEDYRSLVVRVSGFSAYFTTLEHAVQEDILARTEHALT